MKIALWKPKDNLRKEIKKLNPRLYHVTKEFLEDVTEADVNEYKFDAILIEDEGYREERKFLVDNIGIEKNKIFTFREFWVRDCEKDINAYYHDKWKKLYEAGICEFSDIVVLILGGGSGIGLEAAKAFYYAGANVIIAGRNKEKLDRAVAEVGIERTKKIEWDITDVDNIKNKIKLADCLYKDNPVSVVIDSVGVDAKLHFFDINQSEYDNLLNTNLKGPYMLMKEYVDHWKKSYIKGHMVNVISCLAEIPAIRPYSVAKLGLEGATNGIGLLAAEYGITVNGISPGSVATPVENWNVGDCPARRANRIGRVMFPCEIADLILVLSGRQGEIMPGVTVYCDGGEKWFTAMHDW